MLSVGVVVLAASASAADVRKGEITVVRPQIRASLGRAPSTAGYLTVRNSGARADRLVWASCTCAERVELHTHQMQAGVARMSRVPAIVVPARGHAVLAPGGAHLMFVGLKAPVREGSDQRVALVFERAGTVTAVFHARSRIAPLPSTAEHAGH